MKKFLSYILTATLLAVGSSCSDSFLDRAPELSISPEGVTTSATRMEAGMLGVYMRAKGSGYLFGGYLTLAGDNRTDDMVNESGNGVTFRDCYAHNVGAGTSYESMYTYQNAYLCINNANIFMKVLEDDNLPIDDATKTRYTQECKFVRAITYFYMSQLFGQPYKFNPQSKNVPLRLEAIDGPGFNDCPAATTGEILNQVLEDTKDYSALPAGFTTSGFDATRASQAAVHALRMRVFMCMDRWQDAINEASQIQGFSLIPNVMAMFDSPYACTAENIFSIPFTDNDAGVTQRHPVTHYSEAAGTITCINNINGIWTEYGIEGDARTAMTHTDKNGYTYTTKWDDMARKVEWIPLFRYGEILLNLAECYYNLGDEAKAIEYLKQVRTRSIAAEADPLVSYTETGAALWTAIDNERRWEFLGEGLRGYDIFRRAENFRHPKTDGSGWNIVATPDDRATYCWPYPVYETSVNESLSN